MSHPAIQRNRKVEDLEKQFASWIPRGNHVPTTPSELIDLLQEHRHFEPQANLNYGDHGIQRIAQVVREAIKAGKKIALYADYDVDGTMSCVSWIWFFRAIGFRHFVHYIPCRFKEGYGLNLKAVQHLVENEKAELVITMDTGITANIEAQYCKSQGVEFICTDHHKIQPEKMPDCLILNPKLHPNPLYQELCGCGVTFVLLRKLAEGFQVPPSLWIDLLALTGMATICDVVPLNGVNHRLARQGVRALAQSQRPILKQLLIACKSTEKTDEKDIGFRLGPRINAVGRLEHADVVVEAFIGENPRDLIPFMESCNERRRKIQGAIVEEARSQAQRHGDDPILFLGGTWHQGVVGIAASKLVEEFWRPVWLFERKENLCKGSARSVPGFDVTAAMGAVGHFFAKFGGHAAAGGFAFDPREETSLRAGLTEFAQRMRQRLPELWQSKITYDCLLIPELIDFEILDVLGEMKPFGHGFEEPKFLVEGVLTSVQILKDRLTGVPKHSSLLFQGSDHVTHKVMFFNRVIPMERGDRVKMIVSLGQNMWQGQTQLVLYGQDIDVGH